MFASGFHPGGRDGPYATLKVNFVPPHPEYLAGARGCENREFKSQSGRGLSGLQVAQERGKLQIAHGRVMPAREPLALGQELIQVPAPARRVFAAAEPLGLSGVQDALDPTAEAGRCFRLLVPQRLE